MKWTANAQAKAKTSIKLVDDEGEIDPVPTGSGHPDPEIERLSAIVKQFNEQWGNFPWEHKDHIIRVITQGLPQKVNADEAYSNAKANSDKQNTRIEHNKPLGRAILEWKTDHTELFK